MTKTRRGRPVPPLHNPDPADGVGVSIPVAECMSFVLRGTPIPDSALQVGDLLTAHERGNRIRLMRDGTRVGWIEADAASELVRCISRGTKYSGSVLSVSDDSLDVRFDAET